MIQHKGFNIVRDKSHLMFVIKRPGKGAMPKILMGMYTSTRDAMTAIYIREYSNGKTE